ncbi:MULTISPECIES: STM4015 family protein [unclassified Solwaraspora]|uniref:STM4015 family protein n=1 Tax=unclassified Solwaraspora TaxID=2627926 RepID=UPI00259B812B|nr:STM4015 family protein [Solwaraspora sp. WMMA2056]WJK38287.1 STM4015 family protein [Solwaraspora sp. WMMA2056]
MTINEHITHFSGLPVVDFDPQTAAEHTGTPVAWRLSASEEDEVEFAQLFTTWLDTVDPASVDALVVGDWGEPWDVAFPLELLVDAAPRLTGLRAVFLGEMTFDECEISWILQPDVTPLLAAYPALEVLRVRGAMSLELQAVQHTGLREFAIESGGTPAALTRAVAASDLPNCAHLELWLGTPDYEGDTSVDDLAPILDGTRLPTLRTLGLRNAEIADAVAAALASAAVVPRLDTVDLSLGTLGDDGATALLAGQPLTHLRRLDLHRHYLSDEMMARLPAALPGVDVDVTDQQTEDRHRGRYVSVGE